MKRKLLITALALSLVFTACGKGGKSNSSENSKKDNRKYEMKINYDAEIPMVVHSKVEKIIIKTALVDIELSKLYQEKHALELEQQEYWNKLEGYDQLTYNAEDNKGRSPYGSKACRLHHHRRRNIYKHQGKAACRFLLRR